MNGKLDFPLLQTLRLSTARANIARPGATPKVRLAGLLQNRNPIRPMENKNPPERENLYFRIFPNILETILNG
jgi:hypothetical protein